MTAKHSGLIARLWRGRCALLLALTLLAPGAMAQAPAPAPNAGRIWIYREYEPFLSLAQTYVRLNGAVAGVSVPGGAFYRDVAPGAYTVTADSDGIAPNQFVTVAVSPGQQVFVKVLSDINWDSGGGGRFGGGAWRRDTFYTWQMQPQAAAAEIAQLPHLGG